MRRPWALSPRNEAKPGYYSIQTIGPTNECLRYIRCQIDAPRAPSKWPHVNPQARQGAEAQHFAALIARGIFSSMPVLEVASPGLPRSRRQLAGL